MTLMVTIVEKRKQYEKKIVDTFFIIGPKKYLLIVISSRKSFCLHESILVLFVILAKRECYENDNKFKPRPLSNISKRLKFIF